MVIVVIAVIAIYTYYTSLKSSAIHIRISTTTSLYATGLLSYLAKEFNTIYPGISIDFIAVGSGAALELAARGDVCAVLVHAPSLEATYIRKGVIERHRIFAYNYFVIVGPPNDPANIRNATSAIDAFRRIFRAGEEGRALFVSRGDGSGTNVRELSIWSEAGLDPRGRPWYRVCGCGMGQALVMASELSAYTLSDVGTYLKYRGEGRVPNLVILYTNSSELINIYSMYIVKSCRGVEREYAEKFLDFIYSHQDLIARYGVDRYGKPLFYPAKDREPELYRIWREFAGLERG